MTALKAQGLRRLLAGARRALPFLILAEASLLAAEPADPYLWLEDIEGNGHWPGSRPRTGSPTSG